MAAGFVSGFSFFTGSAFLALALLLSLAGAATFFLPCSSSNNASNSSSEISSLDSAVEVGVGAISAGAGSALTTPGAALPCN